MSKLLKVDEVVGRLIEGRHYLVPTIAGTLGGKLPMEVYPIIGPRHYDVEFLNIHMPHYHLDLRFMNINYWRNQLHGEVVVGVGRRANNKLPVPHYEDLECLQADVIINITSHLDGVLFMREHFTGKKCGGSRAKGWVCPHKGVYLGSTPANYDGVITCPAHGLKIDALTGKVIG